MKRKSKVPLEAQALEALRKAVEKVIEEHRLSGDPIVIWKNGRVAWVPADQIEIREEKARYGPTAKKSKGSRR